MKNSIGSLAALSAFAVPALLHAAPQVADFSNVPLPYDNSSTVDLDIDGNGTADFHVYSNGIYVMLESFENNPLNLFTASPVQSGDLVETTSPVYSDAWIYIEDENPFSTYYGVQFERAGEAQLGWIFFNYVENQLFAVSGGWESTPDAAIIVGTPAIPEPSTYAALTGVGTLLGAIALRRRRASS